MHPYPTLSDTSKRLTVVGCLLLIASCAQIPAEDASDQSVGRALLSLVAHARGVGVDPEMALRAEVKAAARQIRAFESEQGDGQAGSA